MTIREKPQLETIGGWPFRVYQPPKSPSNTRLMLLLHGHLGNENAMWILTNPIPKTYALLAPRAPAQTGPGQYSWHSIGPQWPSLEAYRSLANALLERVDEWGKTHDWPIQQIDVMGFSQGAVLALAMGILYPGRIGKTSILAGFLPQTWISQLPAAPNALTRKTFFIAHGNHDDVVPITKAQRAAAWLKEKGAEVTFCEADTGHKLSAHCFKSLGKFFT